MGVDLCMHVDGKYVSCLGRYYHYEPSLGDDLIGKEYIAEIDRIIDKATSDIYVKVVKAIGYCPNSIEEVDKIALDIVDDIGTFAEELVCLGRVQALSNIIAGTDNSEVSFVKE